MWLEIGWLFCNLFQVPELWADFRGFWGGQLLPRHGQSEWFSVWGPLGAGKPFLWPAMWWGGERACLTATMTSSLTDASTVRAQRVSPLQGALTYSTSFDYYSNYVKQIGYTKFSSSPLYRVEPNRNWDLNDFPDSLNDWVIKQGEVCSPL